MMQHNDFQTNKPQRIGYALSGGFIKGFAHLGVIQALLEHDIKPDIISGVSAGALAGAFYADGYEPYKAIDIFNGYKFMDLTSWALTRTGFFKLDDFKEFLKTNLRHQNLEEMEIPLIITATDLDHGKSVQFRKGNIADLVAASCCMPVMFAPVNIEGTNYVDGGVFKNLPVSTIRKDCEKVVAINVSPLIAGKYKMNIIDIALRSYHFMFRANTFPDRENSDLLIEPYGLNGYGNRELGKAEEIFKQGYDAANKVIYKLEQEKGNIWK